jgi:pyrroline-5-carboxylate reductase
LIERIGIIGVGHLASYLVEGLRRASHNIGIILSPRNAERATSLAKKFKATVAKDNQAVADTTDIIMLTTRPEDTVTVSENIAFRSGQTVISVSVGLPIETLKPVISPATVVRAMPITCASINQSPTLLFPDNSQARKVFTLLGQVHILSRETYFTPASVIAAFYGWMYALFDEVISWTAQTGVPRHIARSLVLETVQGAVNMALNDPSMEISNILEPLITPRGITEQGLNILHQQQGLTAWTDALEAVLERLSKRK